MPGVRGRLVSGSSTSWVHNEWARGIVAALIFRAAGQFLFVTGLLASPMLLMATAGEPYRTWWQFVSGGLALSAVVGVTAALVCLVVNVSVCAKSPSRAVQFMRQASLSLRRTPTSLSLGFALLGVALLVGVWSLTHASLEILAGDQNRREGMFVLAGGAGLSALLAAGSVALNRVLVRHARRLDTRCATLCERCGYDLSGLDSDRCPECGDERGP